LLSNNVYLLRNITHPLKNTLPYDHGNLTPDTNH
jgi:hypothetical protein